MREPFVEACAFGGGGRWQTRRPLVANGLLTVAVLLAGCGGGLAPAVAPSPTPAPVLDAPIVTKPAVRGVLLPTRLGPTTWRVSTTARLAASGAGARTDEQRVESRALVSWSFSRTAAGALRGTGQVDSFLVRSTLDTVTSASGAAVAPPGLSAMLLIEAVLDSATSRVIMRPPLANECDRPEASAASLARELLVRVPDGAVTGDRWRDSTVTLVCRSGVPMTVYTTVRSTLARVTDEQLLVQREISTRLEGKGGSVFRALDLSGTGTGSQRVQLRVADGSISSLEGSSTMTLQLKESAPPAAARVQQLVQRVEVKVERVSR